MATKLEETTETAKKVLAGCGILIAIILLYSILAKLLQKEPPPYNPYPTVAEEDFGSLPDIELTSLELIQDSKSEYRIDTIDGKLPDLFPIVNVYKTKTPHQSLTAHDDAVEIAKSLQYTDEPTLTSTTQLEWRKGARILKIDKLYKTTHLTTDYSKDPKATESHDISPDLDKYINAAQNYLKNANLLPDEYIQSGKHSANLLRLNKDFVLIKASSASEANFVRVDFFKEIESVGVTIPEYATDEQSEYLENQRKYSDLLTDNPYEGSIYIILGGTGGTSDIYEIHYTEWELSQKTTYYAEDIESVWESVKNNEGLLRYLADINANPFKPYTPLNIETFLLTNVEIVYYTSQNYIQYIQPIYKLSGIAIQGEDEKRAEFIIYYPATRNPDQ